MSGGLGAAFRHAELELIAGMISATVYGISSPTASMLARVAPGRPIINNFLAECRSGHSSSDMLMEGLT